jgi:cytochrome c oxidase subunit 4
MAVDPHSHAHSPRLYYLVFAGLILLTAATTGAAYVPLGEWHTPIGILIAVAKGTLIVLFFMHALESGRLVWMVLAVALLFLGLMFAFTFADFATRRMDAAIRDPAPPARLSAPPSDLK